MNSYIIDYDKKEILLTWREQEFTFNLNEGDIGDYWNHLTHNDGTVKNINFHQEEGELPNFEIYGALLQDDGTYAMGTDEEYIQCDGVTGDANNYFNPPLGWIILQEQYFINEMHMEDLRKKRYAFNREAQLMLEAHKDDKKYCKDFIDFVFNSKVDEVIEFHLRKKFL